MQKLNLNNLSFLKMFTFPNKLSTIECVLFIPTSDDVAGR